MGDWNADLSYPYDMTDHHANSLRILKERGLVGTGVVVLGKIKAADRSTEWNQIKNKF